jgi:hypothetical protein
MVIECPRKERKSLNASQPENRKPIRIIGKNQETFGILLTPEETHKTQERERKKGHRKGKEWQHTNTMPSCSPAPRFSIALNF